MARVTGCTVVSNKDEVIGEMRQKVLVALESIGETAASASADVAPVDTGRLKGSITSAVVESELCVYIGTNVEYAPYQEFGTSRGITGKHFIQYGAQSTWNDSGKTTLENILKSD
jgi:phage gpG-like protein